MDIHKNGPLDEMSERKDSPLDMIEKQLKEYFDGIGEAMEAFYAALEEEEIKKKEEEYKKHLKEIERRQKEHQRYLYEVVLPHMRQVETSPIVPDMDLPDLDQAWKLMEHSGMAKDLKERIQPEKQVVKGKNMTGRELNPKTGELNDHQSWLDKPDQDEAWLNMTAGPQAGRDPDLSEVPLELKGRVARMSVDDMVDEYDNYFRTPVAGESNAPGMEVPKTAKEVKKEGAQKFAEKRKESFESLKQAENKALQQVIHGRNDAMVKEPPKGLVKIN